MQPTFFPFKTPGGGTVPALVFGTKAGQLYVLDRATGKPLTELVETPLKAAHIPGEPYALTQPRSVGMPQIGAQTLTESDMWGATVFDQLMCRIAFRGMRYEGLYTAPDTDPSLSFPGSLGGMNGGGLSIDPTTNTIYANDMRLGKDRFFSPYTRSVAWQVPLGTVQDSVLHGVRIGLKMPVGVPTIGGSLATQGGLVFFAATQDYYLRAFDSGNGRELWKARMPVGSQGTPITFRSPKTGRQYVVISAGGARQSADRGDDVIAYALPR
jgi:quinate dehydrogenase (quinone)